MNRKQKQEALTILQSIGLLVDSHLRECDAIYGNKELIEDVEDLAKHIERIHDKIFLTM